MTKAYKKLGEINLNPSVRDEVPKIEKSRFL